MYRILKILFIFSLLQKLYQDMESRIENAAKVGQVPEEVRPKYKGFSQWDSYTSRRDHDTILQVNCFLNMINSINCISFDICHHHTHAPLLVYNCIYLVFSCQILLHKNDHNNSKDVDGFVLPALVYLAREKRPQYFHNFKAGAMNSLVYILYAIL